MKSATFSLFPKLHRMHGAFALLTLSATVLMTGCQLTGTAMPDTTGTFSQSSVAFQGVVHGGTQPIGGALIQLYAVGTGSAAGVYTGMATPLLTSTVRTAYGTGNFSITGDYNCPSNAEVYITASGGSPDGNSSDTNPNITLMAALGNCATLKSNAATTYIHINEVTTVAAAYALAQFATTTSFGTALSQLPGVAASAGPPVVTGVAPADNIVTSPSNATGLNNAMAVAQVLANGYNYTGVPNGLSPGSNTNGGATAEYWTVFTIADALSACVNTVPGAVSSPTDGSVCGNLYKYTTPTGKTAPADTFQAALYLALYPTNAGVLTGSPQGSNLVNLIQTTPPFFPYVNTSVPGNSINDWTIAINYVPVVTGTTTPILTSPYYIAVDSVGNVWEYDTVEGTGSPAGYVTETDPTGNPVFAGETACAASPCVLSDFAIKNYKVGSTNTPIGNQPGNGSPSGIAIDPSNNVWVSDRGGSKFNVFKITGSGTGSISNGGGQAGSNKAVGYSLIQGGTSYLPVGMAVDGNGNPWFTEYGKSGGNNAAPNTSCTSQSEPGTGTNAPQVIGTIVSGAAQLAGPGYSGGSNVVIDAGNPSCTVSSTTLCNTTIYDSLPATPTTALSGSPFIWVRYNTPNALPNTIGASFIGHYTTGNGSYSVPGCLSPLGYFGSANTTPATPTTGIAAINPSGSDQIDYGAYILTVAIGKNGVVWSTDDKAADANSTANSSSLQRFLPNYGTAFTSASFVAAEASPAFSSFTGGGLGTGFQSTNMVLDGSGAPWITGIPSTGNTYVVSFDANGNALSPSTGITGTVCYTNSQTYARTTGQTSYGIAVDPSGNVWVADGDEGNVSGNGTTLVSNSMYEIVGAAVPVVTPLSLGVKNGTLATMP